MLREAWAILSSAVRDLRDSWRRLVLADLIYRAISFVVLAPLATVLLTILIRRTGRRDIADIDILRFFVTTRQGVAALLLVGALALAISAIEQATLMTLGLGAQRGARVRVPAALGYAFARAWPILRLTLLIVVRILALTAPILLGIGLTYWGLLHGHDINFYLTEKPPVFWLAVALAAVLLAAGAAVLIHRVLGWLLALPAILFEGTSPSQALRAGSRRLAGRRRAFGGALVIWAAAGVGLHAAVWGICAGLGRLIAPVLGRTLTPLLLLIGALVLLWVTALLAIAVLSSSLLALLILRIHERTGSSAELHLSSGTEEIRLGATGWTVSWRAVLGGLAAALVLTTGVSFLALRTAWTARPVLVIGHRGTGTRAPENTEAAFRKAIDAGADLVELDVQESSDGVVLVVHDSDLMKVGGSPLKIWESPAESLRQVDVGSYFSPEYREERVPTLAEVLALCKGKVRVDIELKSYGHDQKLEERVVDLVETAGMANEIVTMSMNHAMVQKMKELRPEWTSGILTARAIGNLTRAPADFLAVESRMATRSFLRRAHRAGKPVYIWTLNDPARMLEAIAAGADGLITDDPALARQVVDRHAAMEPAERLLVALLVRFGKPVEQLLPESELRP